MPKIDSAQWMLGMGNTKGHENVMIDVAHSDNCFLFCFFARTRLKGTSKRPNCLAEEQTIENAFDGENIPILVFWNTAPAPARRRVGLDGKG